MVQTVDVRSRPQLLFAVLLAACVPSGSAPPSDAGASVPTTPAFRPSVSPMTTLFEDSFDRKPRAGNSNGDSGGDELGPDWTATGTTAWRIENGRLCGQGARNHGVWLNRTLPVNARIEFDAIGDSPDGDLKAELWGDGRSSATSVSYTNATSYLAILGGWKNKFHVLARINEHGKDRKEVAVDPTSDDPRQRAVVRGQVYRFKIERTDAKTVRWSVDGVEMLSFVDASPLAGMGHDHFGFNNWEVKVCFDNVRVTPL